jgi:large subunit ribosomal protein L21
LYAVVRTGGKQYRVQEGRSVTIERLPGEPGDTVELADVLLMADGDAITVGAPVIEGARIVGTIAEQGRAKKIIVFRYKAKTRARKKNGHRQHFTKLIIDDILAPGQQPKPKAAAVAAPAEDEAPKSRRARKPATAAATAPAAAAAAPAEDEAPKSRRTRKASTTAAPAAEASAETAPVAEKPKRTRKKAE